MSAATDRICYCCHRRESVIDHVRVGPAGKASAERVRRLMSWYRPEVAR